MWSVRPPRASANWVKTQGGSLTVAISYDSRLKSDVFAKTAAGVLAANGIKVRIYDALMPVPALSFATRYYQCNAGIIVTAPTTRPEFNGYKAYGPDGCQMTDDAAAIMYAGSKDRYCSPAQKVYLLCRRRGKWSDPFCGEDYKAALHRGDRNPSGPPRPVPHCWPEGGVRPLNSSGPTVAV